MCGILGIAGRSNVAAEIFDGLTVLQHRGQDASGISTLNHDGKFFLKKGNGLVRDVFRARHIFKLAGNFGIGHVRYPTAGSNSDLEAQPFFVNSPFGITLAHNGNVTNTEKLAQEIFDTDLRHLETGSDSEIILNIFAHELAQQNVKILEPKNIFSAIEATQKRIKGSFAVVLMISGAGLVAFRDRNGIRPLCFGVRKNISGEKEFAVSSESAVFSPLGFEKISDLAPSEAIFIDKNLNLHQKICAKKTEFKPCIFEYVYLARPDSVLDKISVYKSRLRMGENLAKKIKKNIGKNKIDVVIPIPETSRPIAMQLANSLKIKFREGFVKNRYIGRTFIMPGQKIRKKSIRYKLSPVDLEFRNKNVLLVDDSIVRGNTSKEIIKMAREAGAKKVFFCSAAPPIRHPCVYGVDMPIRSEFIATGIYEKKIAEIIGADEIFFQDLPDLIAAVNFKKTKINFCDACFSGNYPTKLEKNFLENFEKIREKNGKKNDNPLTLL